MASWLELTRAAAGVLMFTVAARAEPAFYAARVAPILEQHCTGCHGAEKKKAGLRLDSFEQLMRGAESGEVIKPGDVKGSELHRRITLPQSDEEVMPSDGKPLLSADEIKIVELWIAGGASPTKPLAEFPSAPAPKAPRSAVVALAPDWRPHAKAVAEFEKATGLKLIPRSQRPTDGLILRTASAPARCDDGALEKLPSVAALIVEAELARTKVTDAGLALLATCDNLRSLDLTRTAITSAKLGALAQLKQLESLNLTETAVDEAGVAALKGMPALKRIWLFGTKASAEATAPAKVVAK